MQNIHTDPLSVPQRRETSHRKAKGRSILNTLQNRVYGLDSNQADDLDEPPEFVDSDSDPAWTPQKVLFVIDSTKTLLRRWSTVAHMINGLSFLNAPKCMRKLSIFFFKFRRLFLIFVKLEQIKLF